MDSWAEMEEQILEELNLHRMKADAEVFSRLERYSGSEAGEAAVDYLVQELEAAGIEHERHYYELMRSLPVQASVTVKKAGEPDFTVEAIAAVYSGEAHGLTGELVWDEMCTKGQLNGLEQEERFRTFKGKIVLTYDISFPFYYEAARAGALGIVAIWPKDIHHHDTMGGVWGMPGSRDRDLYPYLPYVQILGQDGLKLIEMVKAGAAAVGTEAAKGVEAAMGTKAAKGMAVTAQMDVAMDNRIVRSSMPVATIPGKSESFVLLSGHYDSWYEGMTDNGAANVLMLETARTLEKFKDRLNRTVVIAWWSGHSDGRYSGSTWFCDHHYEYLRKHCVAHINMDICGCKGSNAVRFDMSGMEGEAFNDEFLASYNSRKPLAYRALDRSSDQTFWGTMTPVSIAPQFYMDDGQTPQPPKSSDILRPAAMPAAFGVGGPFYWWHTREDTLDKIGDDVLARDCEIAARLVLRYAMEKPLPIDMSGFMREMQSYFEAFAEELDPDFDVAPVLASIALTRKSVEKLSDAIRAYPKQDADSILIRTAGELVRLKYTYSSPYGHDYAVEHQPYAVFSSLLGVHRDNTPEDRYLMSQTDFIRQRNRMTGQLHEICEAVELQLYRWQVQ